MSIYDYTNPDNQPDYVNLPKGSRIAVGISGGVDSSTTAALLKKQGYEVVGFTLVLFDPDESKGLYRKDKNFYEDVQKVAKDLDVEHHFIHLHEEFYKNVISNFMETYAKGETPIPCVRCNRDIKFGAMIQKSKDLGAVALATGHYIRHRIGENNMGEIYKSSDPRRDQSYFLCQVRKEDLAYMRFPLGERTKDETRAMAKTLGIHVAEKTSSNSLCFTSKEGYTTTLRAMRPDIVRTGQIVHVNGTVMGQHDGMAHYTIGQRKGMGVGGSLEPLYVVALDAVHNRVIVGERKDLEETKVLLSEINYVGRGEIPSTGLPVVAKVRASQPLIPATLYQTDEQGNGYIIFSQPVFAIAPGQVCAFYAENGQLLGGGFITQQQQKQDVA